MFTILIPVLKQGFLQSQLHWLSKQTYRNFNVVVMDSFYSINKYQPWTQKKYPFNFVYLPLIHNVSFPKRCDYSIKNNLAFLSPTNEFVFLSDTHYMTQDFVETLANYLMKREGMPIFETYTVLYTAYDAYKHTVDLGGETTAIGAPAIAFDYKTFFYVLNGFDEATTYCHFTEHMFERMVNTNIFLNPVKDKLFHILHGPVANNFGKMWIKPCEKCASLFPRWKFASATETGEFPVNPVNKEDGLVDQMTYMDPDLGIQIFQCSNCGFGGSLNPVKYRDLIISNRITDAPKKLLDGRAGRDLVSIYETITKKVNNNVQAKIAYLKTTY